MKKSALLGLAMSMAMVPAGQVVEARSSLPDLDYWPTPNKHTAKRQKRKAAKRRAAATKTGSAKPYSQRHKKGRP